MRTLNALPPFIAAGFLLAACQPQAPAELTAEDEATIRATFDASLAAIRAADWPAWAALFAEDGVLHPPHAPAQSGREAIQEWAEAYPPIEAIDFQDVRVRGAGNLAYATSSYTVTVTGSPPDTGKQLVVFRRGPNGKWEAVAGSFNSDLPLPAPAAQPATPGT